MIETGTESSEQSLIEVILADAKSQADALAAEAGISVGAIEEQYLKEAQIAEKECLEKAQNDAEALKNRTAARARVDARKVVLHAREEAIATILERVEGVLLKMRGDTAGYRAAVANLLVQGIIGVDSRDVVALIGEDDRGLVNEEMVEGVRKRIRERTGKEVMLEIEFERKGLGGGCIVMERGGRLRLDNTIPGRIREMRRQLRLLITAELEKNRG